MNGMMQALLSMLPPEFKSGLEQLASQGTLQKIVSFAEGIDEQNKLLREILDELRNAKKQASGGTDAGHSIAPGSDAGNGRFIGTTGEYVAPTFETISAS